jgi:hypothetical protein
MPRGESGAIRRTLRKFLLGGAIFGHERYSSALEIRPHIGDPP